MVRLLPLTTSLLSSRPAPRRPPPAWCPVRESVEAGTPLDNQPAAQAPLRGPTNAQVDDWGTLYIADQEAARFVLRDLMHTMRATTNLGRIHDLSVSGVLISHEPDGSTQRTGPILFISSGQASLRRAFGALRAVALRGVLLVAGLRLLLAGYFDPLSDWAHLAAALWLLPLLVAPLSVIAAARRGFDEAVAASAVRARYSWRAPAAPPRCSG